MVKKMSKSMMFGISFIEKILGLILLIIGIILTYYTFTNKIVAGLAVPYFISAGILIMITGIILLIVKAE
jgi:hypothetical protein